jgi:predicted transcriptional regulator
MGLAIGVIRMAWDTLKLTADIVSSYVSARELNSQELLGKIKVIHALLSSFDSGSEASAAPRKATGDTGEAVQRPSILLKDIVKAKYVVCLECGKRLKTLKTHLRKAHGLMPKEYFQKFGLDPKKFPLVSKDYSKARSQIAKARGLGRHSAKE